MNLRIESLERDSIFVRFCAINYEALLLHKNLTIVCLLACLRPESFDAISVCVIEDILSIHNTYRINKYKIESNADE